MENRKHLAEIREIRRIISRNTEDYDPENRLAALINALCDLINVANDPQETKERVIAVIRAGVPTGVNWLTPRRWFSVP